MTRSEIKSAAVYLRRSRETIPIKQLQEELPESLRRLLDQSTISAISASSGLSPEMVQWATQTSINAVNSDSITHFKQISEQAPPLVDVLGVVLASNVFSAAVRAIIPALLMGVNVIVKASSRDDAFPFALKSALPEPLQDRVAVFSFDRQDGDSLEAFIDATDALHVYGSDETTAHFASLGAKTPITQHGHGIGAVYCTGALSEEASNNIALDIAAYDQRGCLSPQVIWTDSDPMPWADAISDALGHLEQQMPRGRMTESAAVELSQWKSTVEALGTLVTSRDLPFGVATQTDATLPLGPGYRNIVLRRFSRDDFDLLKPYLKVIGTSGPAPKFDVRCCPVGHMQRPSLVTSQDGNALYHGMERAPH